MRNFNDVRLSENDSLISLNKMLIDEYVEDILGWVSVDDDGKLQFFLGHVVLTDGRVVDIKAESRLEYNRIIFSPDKTFFSDEELSNILHGQDNV